MKNKKLILLLTFVGVCIMALPLFIFGVHKSFYVNPDPDIVYTSNAVLFIKSKVITYFDHPGTPAVIFFALALTPFRILCKLFWKTGFVDFSYMHFDLITFYLRTIQFTVSGIALFGFINLLRRETKSKLITIIGFMLFFISDAFTWSTFIAPEAISIALTVLWLYVLFEYFKKEKYIINFVLVAIAGLATAVKFTNILLLFLSIFAPFLFIKKDSLTRKVNTLLINLWVSALVFIFSIYPILYNYKYIIQWVRALFMHSEKYGQGVTSIFYPPAFLNSVIGLVRTYPIISLFVALSIVIMFKFILSKKNSKYDKNISTIYLSALLFFIIFCKYPVIHYNYTNLIVMIFMTLLAISKLHIDVKVYAFVVLMAFIATIVKYTVSIKNQVKIPNEDHNNSYMFKALKEWTPYWAGDVYKTQLEKIK